MDFKDKNILIVGGSSGIGLSLVNLLSDQGANVFNASRSASSDWTGNVEHLEIDVLENLDALSAFLPSKLDGLVYSVGSITLKPFSRVSQDDFIKDYKLNVIGAAMVIQKALKNLKEAESASIVLISSVAAQTGMGFHSSIASAKAGVEGLTKSLAAELASQNIRVNAVAPSLTDTQMAGNLLNSPEKREASAKRHPIGKFGTPANISAAISFLLSDKSSWITGQILGIDGGMSSLRTNL